MLVDSGEIKQIIIVTEDESKLGIGSIEAVSKVYELGITVSTIGIINSSIESLEKHVKDVEKLARAGGGLCEFSRAEDLDGTIQKLANKTARRAIEQLVGQQLKVIIGEEIEDLEPGSRIKIVDFIEKYGENINLKCVLVFDTGESMRGKLDILKRSAIKLCESFKGRKGSSSIAVITYPGENDDMCSIICDFTNDISLLRQKLDSICSGSNTSVGPAILKACGLVHQYYEVWDADISG